jgi:hypothetical protein
LLSWFCRIRIPGRRLIRQPAVSPGLENLPPDRLFDILVERWLIVEDEGPIMLT